MADTPPTTYICPGCGAEVRIGPVGCPRCSSGAQKPLRGEQRPSDRGPARQSWEQDPAYDGVDLPHDDFDYDDFIKREFKQGGAEKGGLAIKWRLVALILLICMLVGAFVLRACA
jgi:hypothetical protein